MRNRHVGAQEFSFDAYRTLLNTLRTRFAVAPIGAAPDRLSSDAPVAFLRHDVDVSLDRALELARVERDVGVRSTYMVLPDTPLYDLEADRETLATIADMGHEIGIHYDLGDCNAPIGEDGLTDAERAGIDRVRQRLERLGLGPVRSVSFHQPDDRVLEGPPTIAGLVNAYSETLMATYISDSSGRWREGSPTESIETADPTQPFQLLTHPVWWGDGHAPPRERLLAVLDSHEADPEPIAAELASVCPRYASALEGRLAEAPSWRNRADGRSQG